MKRSKSKDIKYCILGTLFSAVFLLIAIRGIDFAELGKALLYAKWGYVIPFLGLVAIFFWVKAVRWKMLLEPVIQIESKFLIASMMVGVALNYIFFVYIGELARTYFLSRQTRLSKSSILGTIILERLIDLFVLLAFLTIALALTSREFPEMGSVSYAFAVGGFILLALIILLVIKTESSLKMIKKMLSWLPLQKANYLLKRVEMCIKGFQSISSPKLLLGIVTTSIFMWLAMATANYTAIVSVGIDVPFYVTFIIMALLILGITLPNSPGHIGVIELCYVIVLKAFGVSATDAFAAGLIFHVILYLSVILFGVTIIKHLGMSVHEVKNKAEAYDAKVGG